MFSTNSDSNEMRTLDVHLPVEGGPYNNTVENCIEACREARYDLAGVEFASQCCTCYTLSLFDEICSSFALQGCGNGVRNGGEMIDPGHCNLACSGDSSELCGGADSYNLYQL